MTTPGPRLRFMVRPARPSGVVLLLHGGSEESHGAVHWTNAAAARVALLGRHVAAQGRGDLVVARLLHSVRGWNGIEESPVAEARWALDSLVARYQLPVCVIGHSMGGRTAMRVGGAPGVMSVVGLAPWLPATEPTQQLAGRRVLIVHGSADHTTSPQESHNFADAARPVTRSCGWVEVVGGRHSMLRRRGEFDGLASSFAVATLLDRTETGPRANLVRRVINGERTLEV